MHQKMETVPGSKASAAPLVERNEKLWLSRKADFKNQCTPVKPFFFFSLVKLFRSQTGMRPNTYQVDAVSCFL